MIKFFLTIPLFWIMVFADLKGQPQKTERPSAIWSTEWSPDGKYIAIGGDDQILWILDGNHFKLLMKYDLQAMIKCLSWHPTENLIAIATVKGVQLFDLQSKKLTELKEIKTGGRAIDWNHTGDMLALGDGAGIIQIIDKGGNVIRSIPKHNNHSYTTLDWHPSKNILVTGSDEILIFDTYGKQLSFIAHRKENTLLLTVQWHPSGDFFAAGDYGHEQEGIPTLLQFWKMDGTLLQQQFGHHKEIRKLAWNKDGTTLATASNGLRFWTKDGKLLNESVQDEVLWGLSWDEQGNRLVSGKFENGQVQIWSTKGKVIQLVE